MIFATYTVGYDGSGRWSDSYVSVNGLVEILIRSKYRLSTHESAAALFRRMVDNDSPTFVTEQSGRVILNLKVIASDLDLDIAVRHGLPRRTIATWNIESSAPKDFHIALRGSMSTIPTRLSDSLAAFRSKFGDGSDRVFFMYRFQEKITNTSSIETEHRSLSLNATRNTLKELLRRNSLSLVDALDHRFSDDLLTNIETFMHGCAYGIALFDELDGGVLNYNVVLESGYMLGLGKPVCLLRDSSVQKLPSDLIGRLYDSVQLSDQNSIESSASTWLASLLDQGLI